MTKSAQTKPLSTHQRMVAKLKAQDDANADLAQKLLAAENKIFALKNTSNQVPIMAKLLKQKSDEVEKKIIIEIDLHKGAMGELAKNEIAEKKHHASKMISLNADKTAIDRQIEDYEKFLDDEENILGNLL